MLTASERDTAPTQQARRGSGDGGTAITKKGKKKKKPTFEIHWKSLGKRPTGLRLNLNFAPSQLKPVSDADKETSVYPG